MRGHDVLHAGGHVYKVNIEFGFGHRTLPRIIVNVAVAFTEALCRVAIVTALKVLLKL
jgi:hypothetical protein